MSYRSDNHRTLTEGDAHTAGYHQAAGDALFAANHLVMLLIDPANGAIVDANPAAVQFYGYPRDVLTGMRISQINTLPPEAVLANMDVAVSGQSQRFLFRHRLAGGETRDVEVYSGPVTMSGRQLLYSVIHDVSERSRTEEALARSELKYRIVANNTHDWEFWLSPDGAFLYCSPSAERITGYSSAEYEADPGLMQRIVHPDDLPAYLAHRRHELRTGGGTVEFRIRARNGSVRWIEHACEAVHGDHGEFLGSRGSNRDVSERKNAESQRAELLRQVQAGQRQAEEMAAYLQRERDTLRTVMENTDAHIAYLDTGLHYVLTNSAYAGAAGMPPTALIGRQPFELFPDPEARALFERIRDGGEAIRLYERPAGPAVERTYWDWWLAPVRDGSGEVVGLVHRLMEVTDRVQARQRIEELAAEAARRASLLNATIDSMADAVVVYDATGSIVSLNPVAERLLQCSAVERRLPIMERILALEATTVDGQPFRATRYPALRALRNETVPGEVFRVSRPRGKHTWLSASAAPMRAEDGTVIGAVSILRDISQEHKAEQRLRQANQDLLAQKARLMALTQDLETERARLGAIIDNAPEAIVVTDRQGCVLLANPAAQSLLRATLAPGSELPWPTDLQLTFSDGRRCTAEELPLARSAAAGVRVQGFAVSVTWPTGERRELVISSAPIRDTSDRISGAVAIMEDVTDAREAEQERCRLLSVVEEAAGELQEANVGLRAQKDALIQLTDDLEHERERLAVTLRSIGDGVIATDAAGSITLMNRVAEGLTGYQEAEVVGRPLSEVFAVINERTGIIDEEPLRRVLDGGASVGPGSSALLTDRAGQAHVVAHSVAPIRDGSGERVGSAVVFQDITERRKLEDEVARANKLEALGLLAGGIAHDFNNLLTAIMGNLVLAGTEVESGSELGEILAEAERAAARARDLTQQLLTFARGGAPVRKATPLAQLLAESCTFVLRGSRSRCAFDVDDDLWPVDVDEGQISQVIQNLVINADEAMPGGGVLKVRAGNVTIEPDTPLPLRPGRYVKVSVGDEGVGIPPDFVGRIFDPYFTTKQKGSGLGLASSYSIIKRHEGHIAVESQVGVGSDFTVYLPAANTDVAEGADPAGDPGSGHGRILVMDDEQVVRNVLQRMLERLGYDVTTARDGEEAIGLYRQARDRGEPYAAVIMDLTVPGGMGGLDAMARLGQVDADIRAIVSSGYSNDPVMSHYRDHGFRGVMTKPYRLDQLGKVLRDVLNE